MSMDMNEIHAIFFEESFEGVDTMEAGLLKLDAQSTDSELIIPSFARHTPSKAVRPRLVFLRSRILLTVSKPSWTSCEVVSVRSVTSW